MGATIRVLVVDDQDLFRGGFAMILNAQPDITVVGEAADGAEAVRAAAALAPDVVLMDIRMPTLDGVGATAAICRSCAAKVLVLTMYDVDDYVYAALRAGASGFLLKDVRRDELVRAVRLVAAGESLLAPSVTRRLIADVVGRGAARPELARRLDELTERESETLRLLGRGLSNSEIAAALVVSEHTVKSHVSSVLTKLGLRDRAQAVVFAYESGLIVAGQD
ncbi:response regulator transcription factor [Frankia sp. AgB1.9]|uniref:response regulator n=1 Tax=unclassified Frankia TaxID=2632575 RepID=UPI001931FF9E|nr:MULTISPECIES: response regulator transcription factor [unclassified Frankia]MBL7493499.1 response regulator transcription factor [Frankia sp. AgW1.1]MBL7548813.1 response regulator transcription factor [Frankia sp. AgB1.9]MBL7621966.1 response regulator transcription factor [Frankia sp. AgB1.8]